MSDAPALVVTEIGKVALERRPVPTAKPGHLVVEVHYSGVSVGTELWAATGVYDLFGPTPYVPGYQAVGRVVGIGDGTESDIVIGDVVACCTLGTHQRYVMAEADLAHRIEPNDRLHTAALYIQPGVGAHALNHGGVKGGDSVMVLGQGLIGQATAQLARLRGAYVIGTDVSPERLAISAAHCVDRAIDASVAPPSEQIAELFPDGVDVVIESTGFVGLIDDGMRCVRRGGMFVFEGYYPKELSFAFELAHRKQIRAAFPSFIGERPNQEGVLRLLMTGALDLEPLITNLESWRDSADVYARLFTDERDHLNGIVFDWRDAE